MKSKLLLLFATIRPHCSVLRTANAAAANAVKSSQAPDVIQAQLDAQAAQIDALTKQLAERTSRAPEPADDGLLAIHAQVAGIPLEDVRWRVQAGLDPHQAVAVAAAQRDFEKTKAEAAQTKK